MRKNDYDYRNELPFTIGNAGFCRELTLYCPENKRDLPDSDVKSRTLQKLADEMCDDLPELSVFDSKEMAFNVNGLHIG